MIAKAQTIGTLVQWTMKSEYLTYRDQEQHAGDHRSESSPLPTPRMNISKQSNSKGSNCRDDIRTVKDVPIGDCVGGIRSARDEDHDGQSAFVLPSSDGLQVRQ